MLDIEADEMEPRWRGRPASGAPTVLAAACKFNGRRIETPNWGESAEGGKGGGGKGCASPVPP